MLRIGSLAAIFVVFLAACGGGATEPTRTPAVREPSPAAVVVSPAVPSPVAATAIPTTQPTPILPSEPATIKLTDHPELGRFSLILPAAPCTFLPTTSVRFPNAREAAPRRFPHC